jgi:stage II sporulation protein P
MENIYFEMRTSKQLSDFPDKSSADKNSTNGSGDIEDASKTSFDLLENDEFQPSSMKDLLKERELSINDIDAIFRDLKSPKKITASHSTYGTDVLYIYHSHSRESFLPYLRDTDKPGEAYHSKANITYVGEMLGRALERRGLGTTVDSTDIVEELESRKLDYTSSYNVSGELVSSARDENSCFGRSYRAAAIQSVFHIYKDFSINWRLLSF